VSGFPPLLDMALDSILKERYDLYRKDRKFPPESVQLVKENVTIFRDLEKLNAWRVSANTSTRRVK